MEKMKILLFGSQGMLGYELAKYFLSEAQNIIVSTKADCDISNLEAIEDYISNISPEYVINCAGLVDVDLCEDNKEYALSVNSFSVHKMALACNKLKATLVQISTDHYYTNDKDQKHCEDDPITLVNHYAYTKYLGEAYALLAKRHLIIRTNIIGFNNRKKKKTFLEWSIDCIEKNIQMNLFYDYFTSSIDIFSFCHVLKSALCCRLNGVYNIASKNVFSKANFLEFLGKSLNIPLNNPLYTSINNQQILNIKRADSLGLNVDKIEHALGVLMPTLGEVMNNIMKVYNDRQKASF